MKPTFQDIIARLNHFWRQQGCLIAIPYGMEVGAGTSNPHTFFRSLGLEPYKVAYVEPCRRPADGRYGENPNRLQFYYQYQVILKPAPPNNQKIYLQSLAALGIDLSAHDIRFVEDNWSSPPLGAAGLGWEVWLDGLEITQYTYFQKFGGIELDVIPLEITYGLERIAMFLQGVRSIFEISWDGKLTYGDLQKEFERQESIYNFDEAETKMLWRWFNDAEREARRLIKKGLYFPAYDFVLRMSHLFNLLDARGEVSPPTRVECFTKMRHLAKAIAKAYLEERKRLNYPFVKALSR